jgi:hypothetical protein
MSEKPNDARGAPPDRLAEGYLATSRETAEFAESAWILALEAWPEYDDPPSHVRVSD